VNAADFNSADSSVVKPAVMLREVRLRLLLTYNVSSTEWKGWQWTHWVPYYALVFDNLRCLEFRHNPLQTTYTHDPHLSEAQL